MTWVIIGMIIALAAPTLAMAGSAVSVLGTLSLVATASLIGWDFIEAIRAVQRTGKTFAALPFALVLLFLFALLFFQIAAHLGAEHYELSQAPHWWDWLLFVAAHALRAGDLLDVIEAYGLDLQSIHHESSLVAVCLIVFHLVLNLFLIRLLMEGVDRIRKRVMKTNKNNTWYAIWGGFFVMFLIAWLISALIVRPWQPKDMGLWWLDNLLRVLDVVDAMELFQVKLHNVPQTLWEGSLTFVCRLLMGLIIGQLLSRASRWAAMRFLNGFGMTHDDLDEIARKKSGYSEEIRAIARETPEDDCR
jgi:hypothetical protein